MLFQICRNFNIYHENDEHFLEKNKYIIKEFENDQTKEAVLPIDDENKPCFKDLGELENRKHNKREKFNLTIYHR